MNRESLVEMLAPKYGSRGKAREAVQDVLDAIVRVTVDHNDDLVLTGFGTFHRKHVDERIARNPQNGDLVYVPATTVPTFRPHVLYRELVDGKRNLPESGPVIVKAPKGTHTKKVKA